MGATKKKHAHTHSWPRWNARVTISWPLDHYISATFFCLPFLCSCIANALTRPALSIRSSARHWTNSKRKRMNVARRNARHLYLERICGICILYANKFPGLVMMILGLRSVGDVRRRCATFVGRGYVFSLYIASTPRDGCQFIYDFAMQW